MPREISSRSSSLSAAKALRRGAGAMPPWSVTIRRTPVLFLRSRAREIAAALDPLFQRSHNSDFCAAVNHIRDVTMNHPHDPVRLGGVALTYRIRRAKADVTRTRSHFRV